MCSSVYPYHEDTETTSSKTPLMISSSPGPPDRQLLTANLTAPSPLHFVAVTYIFRVPFMAAVNLAPQSAWVGSKGDDIEPRKRTMFIGTIAFGSRPRTLAGEGFRRSYFAEEAMYWAIWRANSILRLMISNPHQIRTSITSCNMVNGRKEKLKLTSIALFAKTEKTGK